MDGSSATRRLRSAVLRHGVTAHRRFALQRFTLLRVEGETPSSRAGRGAWTGAVVILVLAAAPVAAAVIDETVSARIARDGSTRVLIELHAQASDLSRRVDPGEMRVVHRLATIPFVVATLTAAGLAGMASDPSILSITGDRTGSGGLDTSVPQIRADRVRGRGLTGAGVIVAVLDSGIDANHPDIVGAVVGEECFCAGCCPGGAARDSGPGSAAGIHPHGVHVTGIIASRGRIAPTGVAPGAGIFAVRVLDDDNRGLVGDWLAALDWVAANRPDIRVINMSLVSDELYTPPCDTADAFTRGLARIADRLRARGTVVVTSAGNNASTTRLTAPGCVGGMVTTGAVDRDDQVASFSNGANGIDLLAPGVAINSDAPNGVTGVLSGTSMAAAHVAGTAALLIEAQPGTTNQMLEATLRETGLPVVDARTQRTVPRVDAFAALTHISRNAELVRGSGGRRNDCLLEWSIVPPSIARNGRQSVAECTDNDFVCDLDQQSGQCTFLLSACFNQNDPLLPDCDIGETITQFTLTSPAADAPVASLERINAESLLESLPGVPLPEMNVCGIAFPFVVSTEEPAIIRASVATATRRDYDRLSLHCRAQR